MRRQNTMWNYRMWQIVGVINGFINANRNVLKNDKQLLNQLEKERRFAKHNGPFRFINYKKYKWGIRK